MSRLDPYAYYFLDTGLASYLLGFRSPADLKQSTVLGALFEASVLGQIIRHFANRGMQAQLYYYRDHHGHEVDFIIPVGDSFKLIECKWAEMPPQKIRGFEEISRLAGEDHIISRSVINPVRGSRQISAGYTLEDSIDLRFLDT